MSIAENSKRKNQMEFKAHIESQFSAFCYELKRGPKLTKEWTQQILDGISMKDLEILNIEELAARFEKLVKKSIINPRYGKKNWTEEETEFLVSLIAYYTFLWSLDHQALVI